MGFRLDDGGQARRPTATGARSTPRPTGRSSTGSSNPELRFRWSVARGYAAELGLELRAYLPIETGSRFGFMFGLPIALRAGPRPLRHRPLRPGPLLRSDADRGQRSAPHLDPGGLQLLARADARPARREPGQPHRLPARLRPRLADQPRRRHPHLVPVPRHEPERGRAQLRRSASRSKSGSSSRPTVSATSARARRPSSVALGTAPRI